MTPENAILPRSPVRYSLGIFLFVCWVCPGLVTTNAWGQGQGLGLSPEQIEEYRQAYLPTDPATRLAVVAGDHILVGDLMPQVEHLIREQAGENFDKIDEETLHVIRMALLRNTLRDRIETKMVAHAFLVSKVGSASADQRRDAKLQMQLQTRKMFYTDRVPQLMEALKINTTEELETKLRENGTSLSAMEATYMDSMLKYAYIDQMVKEDPPVSLNEIRLYYNEHLKDYESDAAARWEQLTVRFDKFPDRQAALREIEDMFQEARFGGNVQSVAKRRSQGPLARSGGLHDWTSQGSLRSKPLDHNVFTLPLNRLSPIIEDDDGLHVIRVLERRPAGIRPLASVQDEIREAIKKQKQDDERKKLMAEIRRQVPVWTLYPKDVAQSMPLDQIAKPSQNNAPNLR